MKAHALVLVTSLVLSSITSNESASASSKQELEAAKQQAISREQQEIWKRINWSANAQNALAQGQRQNKPVMFVLVVGHHGKKNASDC